MRDGDEESDDGGSAIRLAGDVRVYSAVELRLRG